MPNPSVPAASSEAVHELTVRFDEAQLEDLRDRLGRTRWADQLSTAEPWSYGTDLDYLQQLCAYWRDEFDWRRAEDELNAWPQFVTEIDGQRMHFTHVRSPREDALPLVLTHGWPGSIWEFMDVIGPLTDPERYGGDGEDAFHVVIPSIPGFFLSGPTSEPGWGISRVASAEVALMRRLGYEHFGAQGGDWGAYASREMALQHPEAVIGLHINLVLAYPPERDENGVLRTAAERENLVWGNGFNASERGYSAIQGTKPQSLAYGLNDSPAGLAAWIVEKFRTWSDCDGDVERSFTRDQLLRNITSYWLTETAGSSARLYYESRAQRQMSALDQYVSVPTGCAIYPAEILQPRREWAEAVYNVVHWAEMPAGGHFAAMEQPSAFVEDVRAFFRPLRGDAQPGA